MNIRRRAIRVEEEVVAGREWIERDWFEKSFADWRRKGTACPGSRFMIKLFSSYTGREAGMWFWVKGIFALMLLLGFRGSCWFWGMRESIRGAVCIGSVWLAGGYLLGNTNNLIPDNNSRRLHRAWPCWFLPFWWSCSPLWARYQSRSRRCRTWRRHWRYRFSRTWSRVGLPILGEFFSFLPRCGSMRGWWALSWRSHRPWRGGWEPQSRSSRAHRGANYAIRRCGRTRRSSWSSWFWPWGAGRCACWWSGSRPGWFPFGPGSRSWRAAAADCSSGGRTARGNLWWPRGRRHKGRAQNEGNIAGKRQWVRGDRRELHTLL